MFDVSEQKNRLDLIDLNDYPVSWWLKLLDLGHKIVQNPAAYSEACKGKIMGTLFYEPSTRTQMSFQTAMLRLGGTIIGFDNPATSSVAKGENIKDTTKIVSGYADIMVMRHPTAGSVKAAALTADCPVINAGDGGHLHPTQTLTDLLTLREEKGRLDNLTIGFCGSQPGTADWYTNNGSLYMCSLSFMPLGLPANSPFWTSEAEPWTQVKAWSGQPFPKDHRWSDDIQTRDKW